MLLTLEAVIRLLRLPVQKLYMIFLLAQGPLVRCSTEQKTILLT